MGLRGCWIYKRSCQNDWKKKEERTELILKSEVIEAEFSVYECQTPHIWLGIYSYLFCRHYFFQIFTDDFLKTHWQWIRMSLSALFFSVLQTEKWKESEDMWKRKGGLYSCIISDTPSILDISLLPTASSLPPAQMDVEDFEWGSAGLLLPTSQRFQSGYKETRLKQH